MARNEIHVIPEPNGGWRIEGFDSGDVFGTLVTRIEAVEIARRLCQQAGARLVVDEPEFDGEETAPYETPVRKEDD